MPLMAFVVEGTIYETTNACLRDVMRMVRVGLSRDDGVGDLQNRLAKTIQALKTETRTNPLDAVQALQFLTLEAEFHYQNGRQREAVKLLSPLWASLEPRLGRWPKEPLALPSQSGTTKNIVQASSGRRICCDTSFLDEFMLHERYACIRTGREWPSLPCRGPVGLGPGPRPFRCAPGRAWPGNSGSGG